MLYSITDEENYLHTHHCTLEGYIEDNDISHQQSANIPDRPVAFHVNFRLLTGFLEVLALLLQCLELLPYVFRPFQLNQLRDMDSNLIHSKKYFFRYEIIALQIPFNNYKI